MAERKRKDYLDIAKGIAMLWIISVHADGAPYTGTVDGNNPEHGDALGNVQIILTFFVLP